MYANTPFRELMKPLSRPEFARLVSECGNDKHTKGFGSWDQLAAMVYAQITKCGSLREIEAGFNAQDHHHYHLGTRTIKRSTLAEANQKRNPELFAKVCTRLMQKLDRKTRRECKEMLYLLDSTSITLKGLGYDDWAKPMRSSRIQGLKLHTMLIADQNLPVYANITSAKVNDIVDARTMPIESSATYVFDKGYCDYNWWHKINESQALFVSRFKTNAALTAVEDLSVPEEGQAKILADEVVLFRNRHPRGGCINRYEKPLRRITVKREDKENPLILATNDFQRSAAEIAELYKTRWQIEIFFKWIKQNLKLKKFIGRSENAVRIQIYTAIIAYLLVMLYAHGHQTGLKQELEILRSTLFQRMRTEAYLADKRRRTRRQLEKLQPRLPF